MGQIVPRQYGQVWNGQADDEEGKDRCGNLHAFSERAEHNGRKQIAVDVRNGQGGQGTDTRTQCCCNNGGRIHDNVDCRNTGLFSFRAAIPVSIALARANLNSITPSMMEQL